MPCFLCGEERNMMYVCGQCGNNICYICNEVNIDKDRCYICHPEVECPKTPRLATKIKNKKQKTEIFSMMINGKT